jgi:hypothetical protein
MPLKFLLDEDSLGLAEAVDRHNITAAIPIDLIAIGGDESLPRRTTDDVILAWAEEQERIVITGDKSTMQTWLMAHLDAGHASPGVFILKEGATLRQIIDYLELVTEAGTPEDFANRVEWIPQ